MTQKIVTKYCTECGRPVALNGIGSQRNWFNRMGWRAMGIVAPDVCNIFRSCADWHDMAVHQGPDKGIERKDWVVDVDLHFYGLCQMVANNYSWFKKWWLMRWADELYLALKTNNGDGYPTKNCREGIND